MLTRTRFLLAAALAASAPAARAHDTWFQTLPGPAGGTLLALGTGTQYPRFDASIDAKYLTARDCRTGAQTAALQALRNTATTLVLRAPLQASSCWVQLTPFDIELAADKIDLYLREIQATPEIRASWAAMQQRGAPWRERYTKHARIELGAGASAQAAPLGLDVHLETGAEQAPRVGLRYTAQALRDGQPLAGLALELRSDLSPLGIWRRTDAQGRIPVVVPLPGRWLLRGVDLRVSTTDPDRWDSRFVTLAFDVLPAAAAAPPAPAASSAPQAELPGG